MSVLLLRLALKHKNCSLQFVAARCLQIRIFSDCGVLCCD
jgi:hypothetical protein